MNAKNMIAAVAAAVVTPAFADLTVALNGSSIEVTATAGTLDETSQLWLVWDSIDRGEKLDYWPAANRQKYSGTIDGSAATYTFAAPPPGSIVRAISTVGVKLIDGYVEQPQGTYFDTGVKDNTAYGIEIQLQPLAGGGWSSLVGSAWERFNVGISGYDTNKRLYSRYAGTKTDLGVFFNNASSDTLKSAKHTILVKPQTFILDGSSLSFGTGLAGNCLSSVGATVLLGGSWNSDGTAIDTTHYTGSKWYDVRIFDSSDTDIAHIVPAVRAGAALLYDTVSGNTIESTGSGTATAEYTSVTQVVASSYTIASSAFNTGLTAYWTGGGDRANVNDPLNWRCVDASGNEVAGRVPDIATTIVIQGATDFNVPAGQTLSYRELQFVNCSLSANCDWSGLANVNTVTVLPVLEYLDPATGTYIDTGFAPSQDTRVVMDITVRSNVENWFGVSDTDNRWWANQAFGAANDTQKMFIAYETQGGSANSLASNGRHTIDFNKNVFKLDNVEEKTFTAATFQRTNPIYLFVHNLAGKNVNVKNTAPRFHSCQIYSDGADASTLVRDFVPVRMADGTAAIYDRANGDFYEKKGSGTFTGSTTTTGEKIMIQNSETVPATIDGTIDLAGHNLTIAHAAGSGTITDTAGGGELHVFADSGETFTNAALAFTGLLKLVKDGAGTFTAAKSGQTYTGGTLVSAGIAQSGASNGAWGPSKSLITIANNAAFDWNNKVDSTSVPYNFNICGSGPDGSGAMYSSTAEWVQNWFQLNVIGDMELAGDTLINMMDRDGNFASPGFSYNNDTDLHYITLNNHKLTIRDGARFSMRGVQTIDSGTIAIEKHSSGTTPSRCFSFFAVANDLTTATVDIGIACGMNVESATIVGTLIDRRNVKTPSTVTAGFANNTITIRTCFRPTGAATVFHAYALGDATYNTPVLDLGYVEGAYATVNGGNSLTFASGSTVTVNLSGTRTDVKSIATTRNGDTYGGYVLTWNAQPQNVTFVLDDDTAAKGYSLAPDATGLKLLPRPGFTIRIAGTSGSTITVPLSFVEDNTDCDCESDPSAVETALMAIGANGLPKWQSWCLSLDPSDPESVVLCETAESATPGSIGVTLKNVSVPESLSGASVTAYLQRSAGAGGEWADIASADMAAGETLVGSLAEGASLNYFRVRIEIR